MKSTGYTEHREISAIATPAGIVEARKGDFVMIVVVRRWEDVPAELAALAAMHAPEAAK